MANDAAKKVAKAARAGGGPARRRQTPTSVIVLLVVILAAGSALVWISRRDNIEAATTPPLANAQETDPELAHWHAAIGYYVCGANADGSAGWLPNGVDLAVNFQNGQVPGKRDELGIHSHGDNVVHIHPFARAASGKNARMKVFLDFEDIKLSSDKLDFSSAFWAPTAVPPRILTFTNGDDCGGTPGKVQYFRSVEQVNPFDPNQVLTYEPITGSIREYRFARDCEVIVAAFVPEGYFTADNPVTDPPSSTWFDEPSDIAGDVRLCGIDNPAATTSTTLAGETTTTTASPDGSATSSTVAEGATTTSAP
jgi:hypothetical protein